MANDIIPRNLFPPNKQRKIHKLVKKEYGSRLNSLIFSNTYMEVIFFSNMGTVPTLEEVSELINVPVSDLFITELVNEEIVEESCV